MLNEVKLFTRIVPRSEIRCFKGPTRVQLIRPEIPGKNLYPLFDYLRRHQRNRTVFSKSTIPWVPEL